MKAFLSICLVFVFSATTLSAQYIIKENVDPFTRTLEVETSTVMLYSSGAKQPGCECCISTTDNSIFLNVRICGLRDLRIGSESPNCIVHILDMEDNIIIIDGENRVVIEDYTVTSNVNMAYGFSVGSQQTYADVIIQLPVNIEDARHFSEVVNKIIRFEIGGVQYTYELRKSDARRFSRLFEIILPFVEVADPHIISESNPLN